MIEAVFTLDYEIYGNGEGSLDELVYDPTEELRTVFRQWQAPFVPFVEVAELELIEHWKTDPSIERVMAQIRSMHQEGCSPALHLHPQWYKARRLDGRWQLDYSEYNLCTLPRDRIVQIVTRSMAFLRRVLEEPSFTPLAFRAGNWLFQPSAVAASVLFDHGVRIDSSVFKGGVRHEHRLDYRKAPLDDYYWKFLEKVETPDATGKMLEIPIYSRRTPAWKMASAKRLQLQRKGQQASQLTPWQYYCRARDLCRIFHPSKLDFCRLSLAEMIEMVEKVLRDDATTPSSFKPLVLIGHSKELVDLDTIDAFLAYLHSKGIAIGTFDSVYQRCTLAAQST